MSRPHRPEAEFDTKEGALQPGDVFESRNGNRYLVLPNYKQVWIGEVDLERLSRRDDLIDPSPNNSVAKIGHLKLPYVNEN